jgi:hypothetical protein
VICHRASTGFAAIGAVGTQARGGGAAVAERATSAVRLRYIETMSGRPLALMLASSLAAFALAGCTLLLVSTDGLSSAAASDSEGGGAKSESGTGEGGPGIGEGGRLPDSGEIIIGPDGEVLTDAAMGFCASNPGHTFCDDFDDRVDIASNGWMQSMGGRGVAGADVALASSMPRSLRTATPAGGKVISFASMFRTIGPTTRIRVSVDVYVTAPSASVGDTFVNVRFPNNAYFDILWFETGAVWITERTNGDPNTDHKAAAGALPSGKWVRFLFESTPGRIFASFDGVPAIDITTSRTQFQGTAMVSLGLYSDDAASIAFNYDNLLVDTTF